MKVYILSLGCGRNLVDSEVLAGMLQAQRIEICDTPDSCQVAIVNTCSFIEEATRESIDQVLELAELKKRGRISRLLVTGCLPQRYGSQLKRQIDEIDAVFGTSDFIKIPSYIDSIYKGKSASIVSGKPAFLYNDRSPRRLFTLPHSAYVKIQEGCRNFCSYCIIPGLRGAYRSRTISSIVKELNNLKRLYNVSEINLIGQDTTLFGVDRYKKPSLARLLRVLAPLMKNKWIRILYTHPAHYDDELISVIAGEKAITKYLDIPIQHINEKVLKKMNRHVTKKGIVSLIERLKKTINNLAVRTTVMVGFPGETDTEFGELLSFIKEMKFERLGCFIYSREDGTPSYGFSRQVPEMTKRARFDEVMKVQKTISEENNKKYLGKELDVLIDEIDLSCKDQFIARSYMDAPEVDGSVYVRSKNKLKPGDFVKVKITDTLEYDLVGHDIKQ